MARPILGFERLTTFCLVERDDARPFMWLQSVEEPAVSFVVVNPAVFFPEYRIEVNPAEIAEISIKNLEMVETYVIVTIPENAEEMTANLQGPIIINTQNCLAKQLILVNSDYQVQHRILSALTSDKPDAHRFKKELVEV
jgi:flagellar assembly factor FliW